MGYPRLITPTILDRIVQIIWHYQQHHNGETPQQVFIYNELAGEKLLSGKSPSSMTLFTRYLVDDDRIEVISRRPFRVTIRENHPKNRRAIKIAMRALEAADALAAKDTEQPKPMEPAEDIIVCDASPEVLRETAEKLDAAMSTPATEPLPERVPLSAEAQVALARERAASEPRRTYVPERAMSWNEANQIVAAHGGNLLAIATNYILQTARPGDLLEQLLDRGYTVHKTNPKWRDS